MDFLKSLSTKEILSLWESFWQSFLGKLNAKFNMSTARHHRTNCLKEKDNHTLQTLLQCYCAEFGFD